MVTSLQPFSVLVEHRVDDVNERLVAAEEPMASGEQIAFQPSLTLVLTQHFHDASVSGDMRVAIQDLRARHAGGHIQYIVPAIRSRFIGTEDAEVAALRIELHDIADECALYTRGLGVDRAWLLHLDSERAEIG